MIIVNNVPCKYVEMFPTNIEFILLHKLIDNEHYRNYYLNNRNNGKYKLLDNSAFELGVGIGEKILLEWAEKINADEIIIPDVYGDKEKTIQLMNNFLKNNPHCPYKIHAVPQGSTPDQLLECFKIMNDNLKVDIIGINKLWKRKLLKDVIHGYTKPLHLLGVNSLQEWFYDYGNLNIRSADSRVLCKMVINKENIWEEEMSKHQIDVLKTLIEGVESWR